jgi:hypothetical protein
VKHRVLLDYLSSLEKIYNLDVCDMEWKSEPAPADTVLLVLKKDRDKKDLLYITTTRPVDTRMFNDDDRVAIMAEVRELAKQN